MSVLRKGRVAAARFRVFRAGIGAVVMVSGLVGGTRGTQDAVANGDTRSITLYHNHTKETATITFRRNGQYDPRGLEQLNWMLRDWRRDEPTQMDPRLFDTVWDVYRQVGSSEPIHINSAYRSPETNAMLRRRSSAVAKSSQHMRGKAMDFYLPDVSIEKIRAVGMRLQNGGVGFYPNAYTPFVHLDVGSVRAWPRMTRDQLVRLFPDGKTVHVPTDGTPLPGYEEAKAEVLAKGGTVAGYSTVADAGESTPAPQRKGFWATLFGFNDEDEDAEEARSRGRGYTPRRAPPPNIYANNDSVYAAFQPPQVQPSRPAPRPLPRSQPEDEVGAAAPVRPTPAPTRIAGLPATVETPMGPKLVWQAGTAGDASPVRPDGSDVVGQLALAPLPPRRPDDVTTTGALAFMPLPPARPAALSANVILAASAAERDAPDVAEIVRAALSDHPMPPPRPAARPVAVAALGGSAPLAGLAPVATAAASPSTPPAAQVQKTAGQDARQGERMPPAAGANALTAVPMKPPGRDAWNEREQVRSMFSAAAASPLSSAGSTLAMGFSSRPQGDLSTGRFTGPAVKSLTQVE